MLTEEFKSNELLRMAMFTKTGLVPTADELEAQFPLSAKAKNFIETSRETIGSTLAERENDAADNKLLVVVGPCSITAEHSFKGHQPGRHFLASDLAWKLQTEVKEKQLDRALHLVFRAHFAKPRTALGWAGLEQTDLLATTQILQEIAEQKIPMSAEFMHERHFARFGRFMSALTIGARNVNDTLLRHAVSAHTEIPAFFKNGVSINGIDEARNAMQAAGTPTPVEILRGDDRSVRVISEGHSHLGLIHRGRAGIDTVEDFENDVVAIEKTFGRFMIDCAHGNARAHKHGANTLVDAQKQCVEHVWNKTKYIQ